MTTDPSTEREEAAEDAADLWTHQQGYAMTGTEWGAFEQGHLAGTAWARAHLAAQEPTAAEVDEIAEQLDYEDDPWDRTDPDITWGLPGNERAEAYRDLVRRVLTARAARRDEEKR